MKTALYVATVARTYRKAIDDYQKDPELYRKNMPPGIWIRYQIVLTGSSPQAFFSESRMKPPRFMTANTYNKEYTYLGIAGEIKDGLCRIEQRNKFSVGERIEIMKPCGDNVEVEVKRILNADGGRAGERAPLKTGACG